MTVLDDIIADKRREVAALKARGGPGKLETLVGQLPAPRDFLAALPRGRMSLIAEIKKASPAAGVLAERFEPAALARAYEEGGAAALSVLTDGKYFQGKLADLKAAKDPTTIPVLRKDFIIDEAQLYESRINGADAVLLIAAVLAPAQLKNYLELAHRLRMPCLVEIRDGAEAERALKAGARLIGINNRDLKTFKVDFRTTLDLLAKYPELKKKVIVSESGIIAAEQVGELRAAGVSAVLVGTSLMTSPDIGKKIRELLG
ncbi:MAG: indole-3-glycerol phosphate synthase TrpC [Candidatus Saganbacteria bacterium]|nr:indole-3-glycerol phosphate synthase TrpC [Candidatus Saganbacteria bacterium]